jgi:hypothetical protein
MTIPGIVVTEIVNALADSAPVRKIEVDLGGHAMAGLHRAPSLASAHRVDSRYVIQRHRAPRNAKARRQDFRRLIGPSSTLAIAYAWPGIDNDWIRDYLLVAKSAHVPTVVVCASLPPSREVRAVSLVGILREADRVVVGDSEEANELTAAFSSYGPKVLTHRALSLTGRGRRAGSLQITAFLPSENGDALQAVMAAFDAIPDSRISNYKLQVAMRYAGSEMTSIVSKSYHAQHVQLISEEMSAGDLRELCYSSSAVSMVDPELDSRAFSTAVDCGVATIVLGNSSYPIVGRGYVGGLMGDRRDPASIHVAMAHALRLEELGFPSPASWSELAGRVFESREPAVHSQIFRVSNSAANPQPLRSPQLVHYLQSSVETG